MAILSSSIIDLSAAGNSSELYITNDIRFETIYFDHSAFAAHQQPSILDNVTTLNIARDAHTISFFEGRDNATTYTINNPSFESFRFLKDSWSNGTNVHDYSIKFSNKDNVTKSSINFYHSDNGSETTLSFKVSNEETESLRCAGSSININAGSGELLYGIESPTTEQLSSLLGSTSNLTITIGTEPDILDYSTGTLEVQTIVPENYDQLSLCRDILYVLGSNRGNPSFPSGISAVAGSCHLFQKENGKFSGVRWTGPSVSSQARPNWNMAVSGASGTPTGASAALNFYYTVSTDSTNLAIKAYINDGKTGGPHALNFTGQHRNSLKDDNIIINDLQAGIILISIGEYCNLDDTDIINIDDSLPFLEISSKAMDKRVFGVLSNIEDEGDNREYVVGNFVSVFEKNNTRSKMIINSLGEGAIWICNINGDLENGDFITTSDIPGLGMRQEEERQTNYTVAKITCDCDFDLASSIYKCEEFQWQGQTYRKAFVGCTYHCG